MLAKADGIRDVGLVPKQERGTVRQTEVVEDAVDGGEVVVDVRVAGVEDVEEDVGVLELLEGGAEGADERAGEVLDEADGVGDEDLALLGEAVAARGGVEGGEELVLGEDVGPGHAVEERALAGVGVAHDCHHWFIVPGTPTAAAARVVCERVL